MADDCLFCRIVRREVAAAIVVETEDCVAFRDISPQAPVHVLVIPKTHIASLDEVADPVIVGRMAAVAAEIARREGVAERGYRTVMNTNPEAGQTVFHLHMHVLGGRRMTWPPG